MTKAQKARVIQDELERLYPRSETVLVWNEPWQLIIAVMLSAQTTDKKVNEVTKVLFSLYKTPSEIAQAPLSDIEKIIRHVNYHKSKARHMREAMKLFEEKYGGITPETIAELMELPGVGRKTANVVLGNLHGIEEGIAVDTHVRRLVRLWGLSKKDEPVQIEKDLLPLIPKGKRHLFTNRCIDYGREYCNARCSHSKCPLRQYIA